MNIYRRFRVLVIAIFLLTSLTHAQDTPLMSQELGTEIDSFLSNLVPFGFSGSVLVEHREDLLLQAGYGMANEESRRPITPETRFDIGSVSKHFTAVAILLLEERGLLNTDDSIALYLDDIPEDKQEITIHHLLLHQSGLPGFLNINIRDEGDPTFDDVLEMPMLFEPGTGWQYSNVGYGVLGRIISIVSDQPYETFMHENLFSPAGMSLTGFNGDTWQEEDIAHGYINFEDLSLGNYAADDVAQFLQDSQQSWDDWLETYGIAVSVSVQTF